GRRYPANCVGYDCDGFPYTGMCRANRVDLYHSYSCTAGYLRPPGRVKLAVYRYHHDLPPGNGALQHTPETCRFDRWFFHRHRLMITIPLLLYGMFRYLYMVYMRKEGGSPEEALLRDRHMLGTVVLSIAIIIFVLYIFPQ